MRHEDLYMIVDCVPDDPRVPLGHRHNSRLSFELFAYGKSFIIDPGTYIYTADPEWRNMFRSTAYHNTVKVDKQEQSEFDPSVLFWFGKQAEVRVNEWQTEDEYDFLDVEHSGYERLADPVIHRRQIFFNKREGYWLIKDTLTSVAQDSILVNAKHRSQSKCEFELNFHFAPMEIVPDTAGTMSVVATDRDGVGMMVVPVKLDGFELSVEQSWISCSYGKKTGAPVVNYRKAVAHASLPIESLMILYPYVGDQPGIDPREIQKMASVFAWPGDRPA